MKQLYHFVQAAVLLLTIALAGCEGEKDLIVIEGNLPITAETFYMVGDATPAGWDISNPTALTPTEADPLIFVYEGHLNTGELKCCLVTGSWDAPFVHPTTQGREINQSGIIFEVRRRRRFEVEGYRCGNLQSDLRPAQLDHLGILFGRIITKTICMVYELRF